MTPLPSQAIMPKPAAAKSAGSKINIWLIVSIILAIILIIVIVINYTGKTDKSSMVVISTQDAGAKLLDFVTKVYGAQLGNLTVKGVTEENGLYSIGFSFTDPSTGQPVDQPAYMTKDGKKFIPQTIDIAETLTRFETLNQNQPPVPTPTPGADAETAPEPAPETPPAE